MRKITNLKIKLFVLFAVALWAAAMYVFKIPCPFYALFHTPCLGCGMTRAVVSFIKFDFVEAFLHHYMVWSLPVLLLCFLYDGRLFKSKSANIILYAIIIAGFILNKVIRIIY